MSLARIALLSLLVGAPLIPDNSITTNKYQDASVTRGKMTLLSVDNTILAAGAALANLANGSIPDVKLVSTFAKGPGSAANQDIVIFNGTSGALFSDSGIGIGNVPTSGEASALAGTSGTPGSGNKYVTDSDSRNTNARTPTTHASTHQNGGSDEVSTATAAANAIPKAGGAGTLAIGWFPLGSSSSSVTVGNDSRLSDSRAPSGSAGGSLSGNYPNPGVAKLNETSGPTALTIGAINDGECLKRVSGTVVSGTCGGGSSGGGNVTGPVSSTTGHVATYADGTGELLADGGALAASATTDTTNASNITSGTLPNTRLSSVPLTALATQAANTVDMNNTGSSATPTAVTTTNAFVAFFETVATTLGDLVYGGSSGTPTRLAGDTSNTRKFLREQSSSGTAAAPAWDTLVSGDIPNNAANTSGTAANVTTNANLTGPVTSVGNATTITSSAVTSAMLANNACGSNLGTSTADVSVNTHKLTSVTDPTSAQDAATKNYVDTVASSLQPIQAVYAASTANIAGVYSNGTLGVGATFTPTATGALSIDGVSPPANSRVLLKNETSATFSGPYANGVYVVTGVGSVGVSPVLTRATDYNTAGEMNAGDLVPVINGTANAVTSWLQTATITTVGTDSLVFVQWSYNPSAFITSLTGGVTTSGTGAATATVVTNANLTGPVTSTGNATAIANGAITNAMTNAVTAPTASQIMLRDSNANVAVNGVGRNWATQNSSGTPFTLTASSAQHQVYTGSTGMVLNFPDETTLPQAGYYFEIENEGSGSFTPKDFGGGALTGISQGFIGVYTATSIASASAGWNLTTVFNASNLAVNFPGSLVTSASATVTGVVSTGNQPFAGTKSFNSPIQYAAAVITAAANDSQSGCTALTKEANIVTTSTSTTNSVCLPTAVLNTGVDSHIVVYNATANAIHLFPPSGGAIGGGASNAEWAPTLPAQATTATYSVDCYGQSSTIWNCGGSSIGTNSGDVALAAPGASPNANGLTLSGQTLNIEYADSSHPGSIKGTSAAQTLAPTITFSVAPVMSGASITSGTIPNAATTATNANTASAIVARDGSGNFTAGTITAAIISPFAGSLTAAANDIQSGCLALTSTVNKITTSTSTNNSACLPSAGTAGASVSIEVTNVANTVHIFPTSGQTINGAASNAELASGIVPSSSSTTINEIECVASSTTNWDCNFTYNTVSANTANTAVFRDGSGNFSAGTITATLTGTASNVTTNANLTGPVTSTGNATAIANGAITNAMTSATASPTASDIVLRDSNGNTQNNNEGLGYTTTVTAVSLDTLSSASTYRQFFTGSTAGQTIKMPDATTLYLGFAFRIVNKSSVAITVNDNGSTLIKSIAATTEYEFVCTNVGSAAGAWYFTEYPASGGGPTDPLTTKGDIWAWSTTDARQPVGSDLQYLQGDSSQTTGLSYRYPSITPGKVFEFFDNWQSGAILSVGGWVNQSSGTSAACTISVSGASYSHEQWVSCTTGSTSSGVASIIDTANARHIMSSAGGPFTQAVYVKTPAALSIHASQEYWIWVGTTDGVTGTLPTNSGAGFAYSNSSATAINGVTPNNNWQGVAADGVGNDFTCDTTVAVVAATGYKLTTTWRNKGAIAVDFYINDVLKCTITSTLTEVATATWLSSKIFKTVGTTPSILLTGYYGMRSEYQ